MHPRLEIIAEPTPLTRLDRLSDHLGIDLHIKRDDLAGPSFGGNKSRQLEFYFGAAKAEGADTILITGAVQSNYVRIAASIAMAQGMHAVVQLEERVAGGSSAYRTSGNVLLSRMMGVETLSYPEGEDEEGADAALHARADELRAEGRKPYIIHLSEGHPPLGSLGYVRCAQEILGRDDGFDTYVVASGSGATHSGLLAGLRGEGSNARVIGSCVRRDREAQTARIGRIINRLKPLYDGAEKVIAEDIDIWDGALAPGYGKIGPPAVEAMKLMARHQGLILDPVYTAKSFAAIPALVKSGDIPNGSKVCFIHTGGLAAMFAYEEDITAQL